MCGLQRTLWRFTTLNSTRGSLPVSDDTRRGGTHCASTVQPSIWPSARVETQRALLRLRPLHLIKHTNDCSSASTAGRTRAENFLLFARPAATVAAYSRWLYSSGDPIDFVFLQDLSSLFADG